MAKHSTVPPILYIADTTGYGGAERYLEDIAEHFSKQTEVKLLLIGAGSPELEKKFTALSIPIIKIEGGRQDLWKLYRILLQHQSWLMHVNLTYYDSCRHVQMLSMWLPFTRTMATIHTLANGSTYYGYRHLKEWARRKVFNRFNMVIAPSAYIGQKLQGERSYPAHKTKVVYNGVSPSNISRVSHTSKVFQIITVARLHPDKGHRYLIQALEELRRQKLDFYLTIVGEGVLQMVLEQQVTQAKLENKVNFHGFSNEVQSLLVKSDVLVLPSMPDSENFPLTILEAMAVGLPVVATKVGGVPEQVIDGETGYLVDSGNAEQLAQALQKLIKDPQKATQIGEAGQQRFNELFTQKKMLQYIEDIYTS